MRFNDANINGTLTPLNNKGEYMILNDDLTSGLTRYTQTDILQLSASQTPLDPLAANALGKLRNRVIEGGTDNNSEEQEGDDK